MRSAVTGLESVHYNNLAYTGRSPQSFLSPQPGSVLQRAVDDNENAFRAAISQDFNLRSVEYYTRMQMSTASKFSCCIIVWSTPVDPPGLP
jgi:hypothetical protein